MSFISFTPNTTIRSADVNTNFANAVHLTDSQKVQNKVMVPAATTLSPSGGGTATCDLSLYSIFYITMPAGNITIALSNATTNQPFVIRILQDAVGSRTVTWFSGIKWLAGTTPTLTVTGSKADTFGFLTTGSGAYDGYVVGTNL